MHFLFITKTEKNYTLFYGSHYFIFHSLLDTVAENSVHLHVACMCIIMISESSSIFFLLKKVFLKVEHLK